MIDDLTRSVVKAHQWLKDNPKEQGKPTQEQIEADIAYAEQNWIGEAKGNNARVLRLAAALRDAQAEVARLREIVDADTGAMQEARTELYYLSVGLEPARTTKIAQIKLDAALKLREGK
jgi:uncharacterized protein YlxW (UPF0749 family)